jgi:hypothetical protein
MVHVLTAAGARCCVYANWKHARRHARAHKLPLELDTMWVDRRALLLTTFVRCASSPCTQVSCSISPAARRSPVEVQFLPLRVSVP